MARLPFTEEQRRRIMWENAVELFNLPRPAEERSQAGAGAAS
jgi:hypothetical protein